MGIGWLDDLARAAKQLLGQDSAPGIAWVAGGAPVGDLASRHGVLGWTWATLVILSFLVSVCRQHFRGRGVVLCDRHLLDALVTLDFVYEGVDLRMHRALIRRGLPKPFLSVYLDVPTEVAVARKPDDMIGEYAVRRQLESYEARRQEIEGLRQLDAVRPAEELAEVVTRWLAKSYPSSELLGALQLSQA